MDGITTKINTNAAGMMTGVAVEINHEQVSHVNKLLQSIPERALVVYERAIRRGLSAGRTQADKEVGERYAITRSNLHYYTTMGEEMKRTNDGVIGHIWFSGTKIPLYRFNITPKNRKYTTRYVNQISGWRVTTEVSAEENKGAMVKRRTAFIATMPSTGHTGIFKRTGDWTHKSKEGIKTRESRPEIRELWGYSAQDMLEYDPAREAIQQRMREIVEKRIDHELLRALDDMK